MSLGPIEALNTHSITQIRHVEHQKVQHEQVQINKNFQDTIQHDKNKTVQAFKSENKEFRYDAKEKGRNSYSGSSGQKKQKDNKEDTKDNSKEYKKPGGFDVLI